MDRIDGLSLNLEKNNIDRIKELFPEAVEEGKINFDMLRTMLGDEVDDSREKYQFTWNGKAKSIKMAQTPSSATLRPCKDKSKNWDTTENLYIEGDNLEVLKQLQKTYYGKIKMIYIDPPYNTGNDFVYHDDFSNTIENYKEQTNQVSSSNPESNGRFHTDWLNMMYPRLLLAKNLLSEEGVIFISIDDNEINNLHNICCEVFGESNFIATMIWQQGKKSSGNLIGINHEYMICFAKNASVLDAPENAFRQKKKGLDKIYAYYNKMVKQYGNNYSKIQDEMKLFYATLSENDPAYNHRLYCLVDEKGLFQSDNSAAPDKPESRSHRPLIHPKTGKPTAVPAMGWRFTDKKMDQLLAENRIYFGEDETKVPRVKRYLSEYEYEMPSTVFYKPGAAASSELQKLMDGKIFENPKDRNEMQRIIGFCTRKVIENLNEDSDLAYIEEPSDAIVLDFFSGSATTAHAVMKLNAEDNGNRKFIMVQLPELCDEKKEAYKAGYKNICDIGEERIRRAGEQIKAEWEKEHPSDGLFGSDEEFTTDIGFKVFKLDSTNVNEWEPNMKLDEKELSMRLGEVFKEGRSKEDILYEIMLKYGVFDKQVEEIDVNGKTMYRVGKRYMIVCLDDQITSDDVKAIGELSPRTVIFNEAGFNNDNDKINAVYNLEKAGVEDVKCI